MLSSYRTVNANEKSKALAQQIKRLIIESGVTFGEASDTLYVTDELLHTETKPVSLSDDPK